MSFLPSTDSCVHTEYNSILWHQCQVVLWSQVCMIHHTFVDSCVHTEYNSIQWHQCQVVLWSQIMYDTQCSHWLLCTHRIQFNSMTPVSSGVVITGYVWYTMHPLIPVYTQNAIQFSDTSVKCDCDHWLCMIHHAQQTKEVMKIKGKLKLQWQTHTHWYTFQRWTDV